MGWVELNNPSIKNIGMGAILSVGMDKRGGHSWGYWADGSTRKGLGDMHTNVSAETWANKRRVIGHTRLATTGDKTAENSHPFEHGNIIGAHNGMVYNHEDLNKKYERDFKVDSQHIFQHINDGLPLKEIDAYGSIVYLNKETDIIHMARFNGGQLWAANIFESAAKKAKPIGFAWCSTGDCLKTALDVAGWTYWNSFELKEDHDYWINEKEQSLYYSEKKNMEFGHYIKPVQKYSNYSGEYGYGPKVQTQEPKKTSTGTQDGNLTITDAALLRKYEGMQYRQLCENCRDIEKVVKHDKFGVNLCYTCYLDMDEVLNTIDEEIYNNSFRDKQDATDGMTMAEMGYMPA